MLEDCGEMSTEPIFVNRPPHIFKHVLSLVTDRLYPYPAKYMFELDFYGIDNMHVNIYDKLGMLNSKMDNSLREIKNINKQIEKLKISKNDNSHDAKLSSIDKSYGVYRKMTPPKYRHSPKKFGECKPW